VVATNPYSSDPAGFRAGGVELFSFERSGRPFQGRAGDGLQNHAQIGTTTTTFLQALLGENLTPLN
jgi:hypothetical protein